MYGAPPNRSGSNADNMNNNPESASQWKGRVLVEFFSEDHKYPVFEQRMVAPDFDDYQFKLHCEKRLYHVLGEFGTGMCLPTDEEYKL